MCSHWDEASSLTRSVSIPVDRADRPNNVRQEQVTAREYKTLKLMREDIAEIEYQPRACSRPYRLVALRKTISVERGQQMLTDEIRYFFYITNLEELTTAEVVLTANGRCAQENTIGELKSGVHALAAPLDNLYSNWAYMVAMCLAWNLKTWFGLFMPVNERWRSKHQREKAEVLKMHFRRFQNSFIQIAAQVVRHARSVVVRLIGYSPHSGILARIAKHLGSMRL